VTGKHKKKGVQMEQGKIDLNTKEGQLLMQLALLNEQEAKLTAQHQLNRFQAAEVQRQLKALKNEGATAENENGEAAQEGQKD
jgi:DNA invertase Pin-like site-specific DNA recombinase